MAQQTVEDKLLGLVTPILDDMGFELVDLVYRREEKGWVIRIFVDREGGVNLDDCASVSREVGALLEVEDVVSSAYRLEISSPGLDRPLKKAGDFERFTGKLAKIVMAQKVDPDDRGHERKTFVGHLRGLDGEIVLLEQSDKKGGVVKLPLADIDKANLEIEF